MGSFQEKNFTIRSKAFYNLQDLSTLSFYSAHSSGQVNIENIIFEKNAIESSRSTNQELQLKFGWTRLNSNLFDNETFAGLNRPVCFVPTYSSAIDFYPENIFGQFIDNKDNEIDLSYGSAIDCKNCDNKWLINRTSCFISVSLCTNDHHKGFYDLAVPY